MAPRSAGRAARNTTSVHLRDVGFSHSTAVEVLDDVALVRRVRQDATALTSAVEEFALCRDGHAFGWRRRFALDVGDLPDWSLKSPGRRMQWHVGAALAAEPDLLVLDEPTNHLDAAAREEFVSAVAASSVQLVLLVSHDRAVLDDLCDDILLVRGGDVTSWSGGRTEAKGRCEAADVADRAAHDHARREANRARSQLVEARTRLRGLDRGAAATRRDAGGDSDTRSMAARTHAAAAARSLGGLVGARSSGLTRAERTVVDTAATRRRGGTIEAVADVSHRDLLVHLELARLRAGEHLVARAVDVVRHRSTGSACTAATALGRRRWCGPCWTCSPMVSGSGSACWDRRNSSTRGAGTTCWPVPTSRGSSHWSTTSASTPTWCDAATTSRRGRPQAGPGRPAGACASAGRA